jgi:hypothetical protein
LEKLGNALAAAAGFALHYNLTVAGDLVHALRHVVHGDQGPLDVGDLIFERLANIEDEEFFPGV